MEKILRQSELGLYELSEISESKKDLLNKAKEALKSSYSPYSNFAVAAALLLKNGEVVVGANQENAAYPSGLCAERVALFSAGAQYPTTEIESLAITFSADLDDIPTPCGSCLQVLSEFQGKQSTPIDVFLLHPVRDQVLYGKSVMEFLPFAFDKRFLGK